jgi:hypothetical protein
MLPRWFRSAALGMVIALLPLAQAGAGDVPKPVIQKAKGDKCVEDTDFMRRNHMKLLNHQRDKTMHDGVRTKQHSLKNCIDCHATADASGKETVLGKDHFCQSCHSYAAVTIDCFQCHSSKPSGKAASGPTGLSATSQRQAGSRAGAGKAGLLDATLSTRNFAGGIK